MLFPGSHFININSFGAKFQTTFGVLFFLTNYRFERSLYVKLKVWMSNSVDPEETAHEPSPPDLCRLQAYLSPVAVKELKQARVKDKSIFPYLALYVLVTLESYLRILSQYFPMIKRLIKFPQFHLSTFKTVKSPNSCTFFMNKTTANDQYQIL